MMRPLLAFTVDSTLGQFAADLMVALFLVLNAVAGMHQGIIRRALILLSVFLGVYMATLASSGVAGFIDRGSLYANATIYIVIAAFVVCIFEVLGVLGKKRLGNMIAIPFDRIVGLIAGFLLGLVEVGFIFLVLISMGTVNPYTHTIPLDRNAPETAIQTATLGEYVSDFTPVVRGMLGPVLPPSGLVNYLANGTVTSH